MNNENVVSSPTPSHPTGQDFIPVTKNASTPSKSYDGASLNKIIKWCLYVFIFLLPLWFLPFTGNVLNFNKQILMIVVLTIALIAWLGKLLTQEKVKWYKGSIVLLFLAFVVVYGLATIFSTQPYSSLMGFDAHLTRALVNIVYFFVFFLLMLNCLVDPSHLAKGGGVKDRVMKNVEILKFLTIFLISSVIVGIIGLLQILGKFIFPWDFAEANAFNTIGTVTSLGIFLAVVLPLALSLLFSVKLHSSSAAEDKEDKQRKKEKVTTVGFRIFLIAFVCIALVTILLLNLRTVWIVTAVGMIMVAGFWLAKRHSLQAQNLAWLAIPVAILALCLIFLFFGPGLFDLPLPMELGLSQKGGFEVVKEVIQRNPILGTGPETFIYNYSLYKPEAINQTIFWNVRFSNAPSEILSLLSEIGILGILAFIVLIAVFLVKVIKGILAEGTALGGLSDLINKGELDSGINKIVRATVINPYEDKFYKDLAQLFIVQINRDLNRQDLDPQVQANAVQIGISNATNSAVRATILNPRDVTNWIIRGLIYGNLMELVTGSGEWAIKSYEQALILEPTNPFIYTEIARIYVRMGDEYLDKALDAYNNAIKIKPDYSTVHFEIALVYDMQGRINEAIVKMESNRSFSPRDIGIAFQLAVLYYKNSQFDKAKAEFIRTVGLDENHSNARYFLGLLFDGEGNKTAAIEQFEKIDELNPGNEHVGQILANLRAGEPALGSPELGPPEQPEEVPIE